MSRRKIKESYDARAQREAAKLKRRILTPEGLELEVQLATLNERVTAFVLDNLIAFLSIVLITYILLKILSISGSHAATLIRLLWYLAFNFYFLYFELAFLGRTPGKKLIGIQVINRRGGELTPAMIIARNLTRQVEIFFPLIFIVRDTKSEAGVEVAIELAFIIVMLLLPRLTKDTLRLGDLIGGTMVIHSPKAVLLEDLTDKPARAATKASFVFTPEQLGIYGDLELTTLEKALRLAKTRPGQSLDKIAATIIKKINYQGRVPEADIPRFLQEFYAAERGLLERGRLFGRTKESQNVPASSSAPKSSEGLITQKPKLEKKASALANWRGQRRTPPPGQKP
ncbi:MAG: RDD family protein [Deltaproteobacteria bacterium]|jgi:uncharacterized RDD family membrane protein YckC|nr:RDD family protein [Deltaproteobacteria bacterium]